MNPFPVVVMMACALAGLAGGCVAPTDTDDFEALGTTGDPEAWQRYLDEEVELMTDGSYVAEGDILFFDLADVRAYFDAHHQPDGALSQYTNVRWSGAARRDIRYCVSTNFGSQRSRVRDAMHVATAAWEKRVDVNFRHDYSQDGACSTTNNNVEFRVFKANLGSANANSSLPHPVGQDGQLRVDGALDNPSPKTLEGILMHELGHQLGFAHEHLRDGCTAGTDADLPTTGLTSLDYESVMYYRGSCPNSVGYDYVVTARDEAGAIQVYGESPHTDRLLGDFDGDGDTDIALYNRGWNTIPIYNAFNKWGALPHPLAADVFVPTNLAATAFNPQGALLLNVINTVPSAGRAIGDFNGDGHDDILLSPGWGSSSSVLVYFGSASGAFQVGSFSLASTALASQAAQFVVGRFNDDDNDDVLLWVPGNVATVVYYGPTFNSQVTYLPLDKAWMSDIKAQKLFGDFNGDGLTDVALHKEGWQSTPIYHANGQGGWNITNVGHAASVNWINDPASRKLLGDFNADGRTDIALWNQGWQSMPLYSPSVNTLGKFDVSNHSAPYQLNSPVHHKFVGDFDGVDGDDIAMVWPGHYGVYVRYSLGNGLFANSSFPVLVRTLADNVTTVPYLDKRRINPLMGDFDGDGRKDIAMWQAGETVTPILFGRADRSFTLVLDPRQASSNWLNNR